MSDEAYTNRELDAKFDGVHEKLDAIIVQTTATNGKVRKIVIALVAVAAFSIGLGLTEAGTVLSILGI